jgi:hypothetical protein
MTGERFYVEVGVCEKNFYKSIGFEAAIDNLAYFKNIKTLSAGATVNIDWRDGNIQTINITSSCTLSFASAPRGVTILHLFIKANENGTYNLTFSSSSGSIKWLSSAPTSVADYRRLAISIYYDGSNYYCKPVGWFI